MTQDMWQCSESLTCRRQMGLGITGRRAEILVVWNLNADVPRYRLLVVS